MDDADPTAAYLAESRQGAVYASHIALFTLSMLALVARFYSARVAPKTLGWDDLFALAAGVCPDRSPLPPNLSFFFLFLFLCFRLAANIHGVHQVCDLGVFTTSMLWLRFGLGRHEAWVVAQDPENIVRFYKAIMANEILYTTALACARFSVVFFYYRIFGMSGMRYYLHFMVAFILAWAISSVGFSTFLSSCSSIHSTLPGDVPQCNMCFRSTVPPSSRARRSKTSGVRRKTASICTAFTWAWPSAASSPTLV